MKRTVLSLCGALLLLNGVSARAADKHVVELFTSQSCFSCPPAERLLGKLVNSRSDIVALEFHVDYWDDFKDGLAGKWTDPFSEYEYSQRQRRYKSRGLQGRNGVFTPQMVVNGEAAALGFNKQAIKDLLRQPAPAVAKIALQSRADAMRVRVSGAQPGSAEIWLYKFDIRNVTEINSGENKGKTLVNSHVVRDMRRLGVWEAQDQEYVVDPL